MKPEKEAAEAAPNISGKKQKRRRRRRRGISPLMLRIMAVNFVALAMLLGGVLYLDEFRNSLIEARAQELVIQGEIIAGAIGEAATGNAEMAEINMTLARGILARLVVPAEIRGRLFSLEGKMLTDSRTLAVSNTVQSARLRSASFLEDFMGWLQEGLNHLIASFRHKRDLPMYREELEQHADDYEEIVRALNGEAGSRLRATTEQNRLIITVAVPVQRFRRVLGALLLSTDTSEIDGLVARERMVIVKIFGVTLVITLLLSIFLASTIVRPIRRLAAAADKVRMGQGRSAQIPDFTSRRDEIGDLSASLSDMTQALYLQIDAVASFAADVSHEMKNPLSSLRSAVESLGRTKDPVSREKLLAIILDDVKRLDRLISDISDASRLDAELSRAKMETVDLTRMLVTLADMYTTTRKPESPLLRLVLPVSKKADDGDEGPEQITVRGIDGPLGQVVRNLMDNAASFSRPDDEIVISLVPDPNEVRILVEDQGPGIPNDKLNDIFERFYSERPTTEAFGKHSGLGLNICRQIVKAHKGQIFAENIYADDKPDDEGRSDEKSGRKILGARFTVILPR